MRIARHLCTISAALLIAACAASPAFADPAPTAVADAPSVAAPPSFALIGAGTLSPTGATMQTSTAVHDRHSAEAAMERAERDYRYENSAAPGRPEPPRAAPAFQVLEKESEVVFDLSREVNSRCNYLVERLIGSEPSNSKGVPIANDESGVLVHRLRDKAFYQQNQLRQAIEALDRIAAALG